MCKPLSGDGPVLTQKTMFLCQNRSVPEWLALYIYAFCHSLVFCYKHTLFPVNLDSSAANTILCDLNIHLSGLSLLFTISEK